MDYFTLLPTNSHPLTRDCACCGGGGGGWGLFSQHPAHIQPGGAFLRTPIRGLPVDTYHLEAAVHGSLCELPLCVCLRLLSRMSASYFQYLAVFLIHSVDVMYRLMSYDMSSIHAAISQLFLVCNFIGKY